MELRVNTPIKFSVIISVYLNDDVDYFIESMDSILRQTLTPYEVILSVDGPISSDMERAVSNFEDNPIVRLLRSDVNIGRGAIKHRAILSTTTELIAIMDADDISVDNRFELQVNTFIDSEIDLVGGYISEFQNSVNDLKRRRKVPLRHKEIVKQGRWVQPYNHVTIMFKKSAYIKSGGYGKMGMLEDYDLFFHMAINGAIFCNIPKTLVYVRTTNDQYSRRHGVKYFKEEFFLMLSMLKSGYIGYWTFIINIMIRLIARSAPLVLLRFFTKSFLRSDV